MVTIFKGISDDGLDVDDIDGDALEELTHTRRRYPRRRR
jgi:hypothetical protein